MHSIRGTSAECNVGAPEPLGGVEMGLVHIYKSALELPLLLPPCNSPQTHPNVLAMYISTAKAFAAQHPQMVHVRCY